MPMIVMMVTMVMAVVVMSMIITVVFVATSHLKQCGWKSLSRAWIREA